MSQLTRYTVQAGDTIHRIAYRQLGSADQWWVLVRMNRLLYPYIDTSGEPVPDGVLGVGGTMLIPDNPADQTIRRVSTTPTEMSQYDALLGVDIWMDRGELAQSTTGDLRIVAGLDNLVRALERRLGTRKGELAYHPQYGSHLERHIGQPHDAMRQAMIRHDVVQTCLADPRITSIRHVTVHDDHDHVDIRVIAMVIGINDDVPLNLVVQRKAA